MRRSASAPPPAFANVTPPTIAADDLAYQTRNLSVTGTGEWTQTPESYDYQWINNGSDIYGETASTYTISGSINQYDNLSCRLTAHYGAETASAESSAVMCEGAWGDKSLSSATLNATTASVDHTLGTPATLYCWIGTSSSPPSDYGFMRGENSAYYNNAGMGPAAATETFTHGITSSAVGGSASIELNYNQYIIVTTDPLTCSFSESFSVSFGTHTNNYISVELLYGNTIDVKLACDGSGYTLTNGENSADNIAAAINAVISSYNALATVTNQLDLYGLSGQFYSTGYNAPTAYYAHFARETGGYLTGHTYAGPLNI